MLSILFQLFMHLSIYLFICIFIYISILQQNGNQAWGLHPRISGREMDLLDEGVVVVDLLRWPHPQCRVCPSSRGMKKSADSGKVRICTSDLNLSFKSEFQSLHVYYTFNHVSMTSIEFVLCFSSAFYAPSPSTPTTIGSTSTNGILGVSTFLL